jgi:hypothetical protein
MTARTEVISPVTTVDQAVQVMADAARLVRDLREQNTEFRRGLTDLRDTLFATLSPSCCPSREQVCDALASAAVLIAKEEL